MSQPKTVACEKCTPRNKKMNVARNLADAVKTVYTEQWQDWKYPPNNKKRRKKERKRKAFHITTYSNYGMKRGCQIMKNALT